MDEKIMDWVSVIDKEKQEWTELNGEYNFTVKRVIRDRHPGSANLPPCAKASLLLEVETAEGTALVWDNLFLVQRLEWKLTAFFRSIGRMKAGDKFKMSWNEVEGAKGRAFFATKNFTDSNGEEGKTNKVARYIDYNPEFFGEADWLNTAENASPGWESGEF